VTQLAWPEHKHDGVDPEQVAAAAGPRVENEVGERRTWDRVQAVFRLLSKKENAVAKEENLAEGKHKNDHPENCQGLDTLTKVGFGLSALLSVSDPGSFPGFPPLTL
jgi:hypothetical protein